MSKLNSLTPADLMALLSFIESIREGYDDDEQEEREKAEEYLQKAQQKIFSQLSDLVIQIANEDEEAGIDDIINPN
jgi:hypothetical protein